MPELDLKTQDPKVDTQVVTGVIAGMNDYQDQSFVKDEEITKAKNVILDIDGISPRPGNSKNGDDGSDSRVYGGIGFYKSDGTRQNLRVSGGRLKKLDSGAWSAVDTDALTNANTTLVQARDQLFIFNGTDNLASYDGSAITVYTALTTPTGLGVAAQGTTGSTAYAYRVSAINAQGETLAASSVAIANGNATLDSTNFNRVTWTTVSGATGYNIWGRKATGVGHSYLGTVYGVTTYDDKGQDDPNPAILPPEGNNTGGVKGSIACFAISRLFVAGDPDNPSRLYWGGVASNITNFGNAPEGGGSTDVYKNDGSSIRAIIPFQGGVIVGKDNAIYKFTFTDEGLPRLEEITRSFGMISHRGAIAVENDIIFPAVKDGRLAFYSLGNQENYSSTVLRANELSIKVANLLKDVEFSRLDDTSAFYFNSIYGCAITTENGTYNNRIICLDTRFGAWFYWDGISPNSFWTYNSGSSVTLQWGDDNSGYVWNAFSTTKSDDGAAISVEFSTKSFNQDVPYRTKRYSDIYLQFKNISKSGGLSVDILTDGIEVSKSASLTSPSVGGLGVGAMLPGGFLAGEASGGTAGDANAADQIFKVYQPSLEARAVKFTFRSSVAELDYRFMGMWYDYMVLEREIDSSSIIY